MHAAQLETYSIGQGGPLRRLEHSLRIARDDRLDVWRRAGVAIALAYVPILAAGVSGRIASGDWAPALTELTTHVRVLVVLPLLLVAEALIDVRADEVGRYLLRSRLIEPEYLEDHRSAVARTARLRDSGLVETALLAVAMVTVFALPAFTRQPASALRWSMQPATLLLRFLFFRLLWRWAMWALYLARLSGLPLALRATHPDRVAGLEPLAGPSTVFALVAMAGSASMSASWGDRIRFEGITATNFSHDAVAYLLVALVVAMAPVLAFTVRLERLRRLGAHAYGAFANRYSGAFERRWGDASGEDALGTPDLQSLNDLGGSFERMQQMRWVIAPRLTIAALVAGTLAPMLPLMMAEVDAATLLMRVAKALL